MAQEIDAVENALYDITISAVNIDSITEALFTYDADIFEVIDLCLFTPEIELIAGAIDELGIAFTSVTPGEVVMSIDKAIPEDMAWSGMVTVIRLRAKATTTSTVSLH